MNVLKIIVALVAMAVVAVGLLTWQGWIFKSDPAKADVKKDVSDNPERIKLSPQAQKNLRLVVEETNPTTYWKKIYLPATVVDRPGHSDRGIPAPIAGVITWVNAVPGKSIKVGADLFRIRLASESFQTSQMELFKSTQEIQIIDAERKRLRKVPGGAVPETKFLELDYQQKRLEVAIRAHRQDLQTRQLTAKQIADIENGDFVSEMVIRMPDHLHRQDASSSHREPAEYEVQELKVNRGDFVQAGQTLAYVADHSRLYLEARALKQEAPLLAKAAKEGWSVEAEFNDGEDGLPGERLTNLRVEFLGNTMDATGLTLPAYVLFENPMREYKVKDKSYRTGQYRPGQKALVKVNIAKMEDVFVLPSAGVVREGPEAYVFRQNGASFDRKAVHVITEDADSVVIENDGSIIPGDYVAQNAAAALNRVLKASQAEGAGGGHDHHHH